MGTKGNMLSILRFLIVGISLSLAVSAATSTTTDTLITITQDNWEDLLSKGEWMVEFFAPWCPACNRFESTWHEFSLKSNELGLRVGAADVNANPVLSGLFGVTSLPTIYHIKDGQYRMFSGSRELKNLVDFVKNAEWKKIDPSSSWLTPNSFLMKGLSMLFKLTLYFKDIYTQLTETYGYPMWAVLTLFVVITIAIGLLVGVVFIILLDCLCPPNKPRADEIDDSLGEDLIDNDQKGEKVSTGDNQHQEGNSSTTSNATKPASVAAKKKAKKDN